MIIMLFGFGIGLEAISNDKIHFGVYTPTAEYGYVINNRAEIYLDTILEKPSCQQSN
jgi:hypothetical protein